MIVTIIGAGNMARGIGTRALAGGHDVRLVDRDFNQAEKLAEELEAEAATTRVGAMMQLEGVLDADLVVLALPYPAGRDRALELGGELGGVVVVDICNPVDFGTFDSLRTSPGISAAEEIAAVAPSARVVKAFNTTFAGTLLTGEVAGAELDVFVAGDDHEAKDLVAALIRSGGMRPLDCGPLRRARELESFQFLHMTMQDRLDLNWSSAVKLLP